MSTNATEKTATVERKGQQVSTTIDKNLYDALEDHRWDVRLKMTDLVRTALEEYAKNHNVKVKADDAADAAPAAQDSAAPEKAAPKKP